MFKGALAKLARYHWQNKLSNFYPLEFYKFIPKFITTCASIANLITRRDAKTKLEHSKIAQTRRALQKYPFTHLKKFLKIFPGLNLVPPGVVGVLGAVYVGVGVVGEVLLVIVLITLKYYEKMLSLVYTT